MHATTFNIRLLPPSLVLLAAAAFPVAAYGYPNIIAVTETDDVLDAFDQRCSLREAIRNANTNTAYSPAIGECPKGSGSTTDVIVLLDDPNYELFLNGAGDDAGDLDVHDDPELPADITDLRIETVGGHARIVQIVPGERVLENHGARLQVTDVAFSGGSASHGAGIYNKGDLALSRVYIDHNDASLDGGGLYNEGDLAMIESFISQNSAGQFGGGVFNASGTLDAGDLLVQYCKAVSGGGIYNLATATVGNGSRIENNSAVIGGGVVNTGQATLNLSGSSVRTNVANANGMGGAVFNAGQATLVIDHAVLEGNSAGRGGAISSESTVPLSLSRTLLADSESASDGGAIYIVGNSGAASEHRIVESAFTGNLAGGDGGALWIASSTPLQIANTTLSGNDAAGTGQNLFVDAGASVFATHITSVSDGAAPGLANFGAFVVQNSLLASLSGSNCDDAMTAAVASLGNNLVDDGSCEGMVASGDLVGVPANIGPLAAGGDFTRTHALLPGSPAIDAADGAACLAVPVSGIDQRGASRPAGAACDIGAHEQDAVLPMIFSDSFETP